MTRVLLLHNTYQQAGGEDTVVGQEAELLRTHGHQVRLLTISNADIVSFAAKARSTVQCFYSTESRRRVALELNQFRPDVMHVHNFFPRLSPSVYFAAHDAGVPVIQTLHNYRLLCSNGLLFRDGRPCEDCLGGAAPWRGVLHGCYRGSRLGSAAVAGMVGLHRAWGTWSRNVAIYIALTSFAREKLIAGGLPSEKMTVKPNFVHPDPLPGRAFRSRALFVGRLSPEKGINTMLRAWHQAQPDVALEIVGSGPLETSLAPHTCPAGVHWLGRRPLHEVYDRMGDARFLLFPSEWYEGFPMTLAEAFSKGTPVIAARIGASAEIVSNGRTGLHFTPGDAADLAAKIRWALAHPQEMEVMGRNARREYEDKYTGERNYELLMEIYNNARGFKVVKKPTVASTTGA